MKPQAGSSEWIYIHLNSAQDYVMSAGIEFKEFYHALSANLHHLLLLKHQYDNASFNMHTHMEYVSADELSKMAKDTIESYGDFCWIDFEDEAGVDEMTSQEIAELLYIGHMKNHLRLPFYRKLNNQYVYLTAEDGTMNRTYYRNWEDFYSVLGTVLPAKWYHHRNGKNMMRWKKEKMISLLPKETVRTITHLLQEGAVISLAKASTTRTKIDIPIWLVGDYESLNDLEEEMTVRMKQTPDAWFSYDRKSKDWTAVI
ncbi:hypothetical protein [Jeotgalibacillus campisalis]|uniref:Oxalate:formate antiporter n=1 Tax=Jeotgalibacillus campisalis TaxID=220754 RepID=A0A0C2VXP3_9BACL|nr:hypothetical protein [Jeotgalibacillus campisalis]KIL48743.1 hypothetical protein KR50_13270 [Jeotgalibacillus campisalis]